MEDDHRVQHHFAPRRIQRNMNINDEISLGDDIYALRTNTLSGHWVAISKHKGQFHVYNDCTRAGIDSSDFRCSMQLNTNGALFHAEALMYERVAEKDGSGILGHTDSFLERIYVGTLCGEPDVPV